MKPNDAGLDVYEKAPSAGGRFFKSCKPDLVALRSTISTIERPEFPLELQKAYFGVLGHTCIALCQHEIHDCLQQSSIFTFKLAPKPVSTAANLHLRTIAAAIQTVLPLLLRLTLGSTLFEEYLGRERPFDRDCRLRLKFSHNSISQVVVQGLVSVK